MLDAMRKIQLSIRYKKLQRLNINLLFNTFNKLMKRQVRNDINESLMSIKEYS
jgi:hypothetical protein